MSLINHGLNQWTMYQYMWNEVNSDELLSVHSILDDIECTS